MAAEVDHTRNMNFNQSELAAAGSVKLPTVGRMVHYFPMNCSPSTNNGKIKLAAIVLTDGDIHPDLNVHYASERTPVKTIRSVAHKSTYIDGQYGYWDWPVMA